jgi:hypothetical protein
VPIPVDQAVFDYDRISIGRWCASPRFRRRSSFRAIWLKHYAEAFETAGLTLAVARDRSAVLMARAVSTGAVEEPITLLVDFGRARTGFAVVKRGVPIFSSTVEIGGSRHGKGAGRETCRFRPRRRLNFRNDHGLILDEGGSAPAGIEAVDRGRFGARRRGGPLLPLLGHAARRQRWR